MNDNANADGGAPPERSQSKPKPFLSANHERMLFEESGIEPEIVKARGYRTVVRKVELERLGFGRVQRNVPALLIPVFSPGGEVVLHQSRPDEPRIKDGKALKYETPSGSRMTIDVHPSMREKLGNPAIPLYVTEGIKKGDALTSRGLCTVSLLGVWNWRGTNEHGGKTVLPEWDSIALNGRRVYLVFDSDVMVKRQVQKALERFKASLESRSAEVRVVYLPTERAARSRASTTTSSRGTLWTISSRTPRPSSGNSMLGRTRIRPRCTCLRRKA
jgi:Domain of unknown function (DUF3854)